MLTIAATLQNREDSMTRSLKAFLVKHLAQGLWSSSSSPSFNIILIIIIPGCPAPRIREQEAVLPRCHRAECL